MPGLEKLVMDIPSQGQPGPDEMDTQLPLRLRPLDDITDPFDRLVRLRSDYIAVGMTVAQNYIDGATVYPPETHPQAVAAHARLIAEQRYQGVVSHLR